MIRNIRLIKHHPNYTHRGGLAKGAASTAGEDICTLVNEDLRAVFTDEKPAVTPSSAARERRETFIMLLFLLFFCQLLPTTTTTLM